MNKQNKTNTRKKLKQANTREAASRVDCRLIVCKVVMVPVGFCLAQKRSNEDSIAFVGKTTKTPHSSVTERVQSIKVHC